MPKDSHRTRWLTQSMSPSTPSSSAVAVHTHTHFRSNAIVISHPFPVECWRKEKNLQWHFTVHQRWREGRGRGQTVGKRVTNHTVTSAIYHSPHSPSLLSAMYTEQTPVASQERSAHTNKSCDLVASHCPI